MKNIKFWFLSIIIVLGYYGICYYGASQISLYPQDISPFFFAVVNLVEVLFCVAMLLFFVLSETEDHSLVELWKETKELSFLTVFAILLFVPLMLFVSGSIVSDDQVFDYPLLLFVPTNFLFVFVAYKMFRRWQHMKDLTLQATVPVPVVNKKPVIDTSLPLMPILWMGDKTHAIYRFLNQKYDNVVVWNDVRSYNNESNLTHIAPMGMVIIYHSIPDRKHIIDFALRRRIPIIVVVKKKHFQNVNQLYDSRCLICKTDNRSNFAYSLLSSLIEEHGKRK
jgi:cytochrome bd-type quinol oxidase subunit 2